MVEGVTFQGRYTNENFKFFSRQHWVRLLWPSVRMAIWTACVIGVGYALHNTVVIEQPIIRRSVYALLAGFYLLVNMEFLLHIYNYFLYIVVVTDRRVHRLKKNILTLDDHTSIDIWMLQEIRRKQRGVFQNLLGFGSLILEAQETTMTLHFIPGIADKYRHIAHLRDEARSKQHDINQPPKEPAPQEPKA